MDNTSLERRQEILNSFDTFIKALFNDASFKWTFLNFLKTFEDSDWAGICGNHEIPRKWSFPRFCKLLMDFSVYICLKNLTLWNSSKILFHPKSWGWDKMHPHHWVSLLLMSHNLWLKLLENQQCHGIMRLLESTSKVMNSYILAENIKKYKSFNDIIV